MLEHMHEKRENEGIRVIRVSSRSSNFVYLRSGSVWASAVCVCLERWNQWRNLYINYSRVGVC